MNAVSKVFKIKEKFACITLDFEMDYGDRTEMFNILEDKKGLAELAELFRDLDIPISTFIRTDILTKYPQSLEVIKDIASDYHCHSHTHNTRNFNSETEIAECSKTFEKYFKYKPLGYRAPQGVLYKGDIEIVKKTGFKFSSSVFPSYRPGRYNNLSKPRDSFMYDNGIMEFPFAVIPKLRYTISLSYLKLLGFNANKALFAIFGLPNVIVFDSHLHDYILNQESFGKLPARLKAAWSINKHSGKKYLAGFVNELKRLNYRFITMTDLFHYIKKSYL